MALVLHRVEWARHGVLGVALPRACDLGPALANTVFRREVVGALDPVRSVRRTILGLGCLAETALGLLGFGAIGVKLADPLGQRGRSGGSFEVLKEGRMRKRCREAHISEVPSDVVVQGVTGTGTEVG